MFSTGPKLRSFRNGDKWYGNFLAKFSVFAPSATGNSRKRKLVFEIEKEVSRVQFLFLLCRHECFTGKYTTRNWLVYDRNIFGSSSKVFENFRKMIGNVRLAFGSKQFLENLRKSSEIGRKPSKNCQNRSHQIQSKNITR